MLVNTNSKHSKHSDNAHLRFLGTQDVAQLYPKRAHFYARCHSGIQGAPRATKMDPKASKMSPKRSQEVEVEVGRYK